MRKLHILLQDELPGSIEIHTDFLSLMPSVLSQKRANKIGKEPQTPMEDNMGFEECIVCNPEKKSKGTSLIETIFENKVSNFRNDFPFLPIDQRVIFLWHSNIDVRRNYLHKYCLSDITAIDLYWLLKGCIELGKNYELPCITYDLMRMVTGFNFGKLAGQSMPHIHAQYGWEVVLDRRTISRKELDLFFEELDYLNLIIFESKKIRLVAPWTPKGQYALDLYFHTKYDICEMDDEDIKIFSCFSQKILSQYLKLGIQNVNIVFTNSPKDKKIEPLTVHFVPRVNMFALYEIKGVNVVDTHPFKIADEFRLVNWLDILDNIKIFNPDVDFQDLV